MPLKCSAPFNPYYNTDLELDRGGKRTAYRNKQDGELVGSEADGMLYVGVDPMRAAKETWLDIPSIPYSALIQRQ